MVWLQRRRRYVPKPLGTTRTMDDPDLRALSCKVGVRKPSETLFRQILQLLRDRQFSPEQVLHVGSRIAHDVVPAKRLGSLGIL